jgi:hypothetical protein
MWLYLQCNYMLRTSYLERNCALLLSSKPSKILGDTCNIFRQNVIRRNVIRQNIIRRNVIRRNIIRRTVIRRIIIRRIIIRPIIIRRMATFPWTCAFFGSEQAQTQVFFHLCLELLVCMNKSSINIWFDYSYYTTGYVLDCQRNQTGACHSLSIGRKWNQLCTDVHSFWNGWVISCLGMCGVSLLNTDLTDTDVTGALVTPVPLKHWWPQCHWSTGDPSATEALVTPVPLKHWWPQCHWSTETLKALTPIHWITDESSVMTQHHWSTETLKALTPIHWSTDDISAPTFTDISDIFVPV